MCRIIELVDAVIVDALLFNGLNNSLLPPLASLLRQHNGNVKLTLQFIYRLLHSWPVKK